MFRIHPHLNGGSYLKSQSDQQFRVFDYQNVSCTETSQSQLFHKLQIPEMIQKVLNGFNSTILVYG
jgi:hypothetical protein